MKFTSTRSETPSPFRSANATGFGVAPALLLYLWSLQSLSSLGWVVALLFTICCGLRLARFNTQIGADLPPYAYNFFTGVPAPAGAGLALVPMVLNFEFGWSGFRSGWFGVIVLAAVGALMVSRVPTFSMKRFHLPREWVLPVFLAIGGLAALATTERLTREDAWICERVQQNLTAGVYEAGALSPRHENAVAWFQSRLAEARAT